MFRFLAPTAFSVLLLVPAAVVIAQGDPVVAPRAKSDKPETPPQAKSPESKPDGSNPGDSKPDDSKPDDSKSAAEKASEKSDSPPPKVIRRDELESEPSNAAELQQAVLGDDGKVSFEFRNQTWPELIQWLSALSARPIDWQELPGDRVNITTPGRYSVEEVSDLLNRHLLGRGYTLLALDGGLTVVKCDEINPSLVPRVSESELTNMMPHRFVRVSLDVGWLPAEKLAVELKPMMSKNGVLTALTTTNRIEAMDSAITLRHIASLLAEERNASSREALAPEFKLRHLPAEEAKRMLEQFLGIEKKKETPMTPQEMQMMQQMRQQQGGQPPAPEAKKPEISVVANNRQNSIIIMAPADRVAIATEFLKRVDVPSSSINSLADVQNRVQVFRLASLDPEKLIEIIQEMNILEPTTRTRVDAENRAVIVSGSAADRYIIDQLIKRLDGTGRQFEVLQLRRLDAGEVAESIAFLMGQDKEEDDSSSNRRYSYFYGMSQPETKKKEDKFRVAANTRFRQVLLWANEPEMAEVRNLLVKLGELPPPGGDARTIRMIDASPTPQTLDYLKRLKEQWEQISPNSIELPDADSFADPLRQEPVEVLSDEPAADGNRAIPAEPPQKEEKPNAKSNERDTVAIEPNPATLDLTLVQTDQPSEPIVFPPIETADEFDRVFGHQRASDRKHSGAPENREKTAAIPIRIEVDRSGNLLLSSRDTEALDRLENLMLQFAPPKRPYRVFKIKHASASWMRLNLEDYFKDLDDEKESTEESFFRWYWGDGEKDDKKEPTGLGKGTKLRFVDDIDTNTIVVNGADSEQLQTIEELIQLWDVPEPVNKRKTRFTRLVGVEFGKASKIAETVKDAYRDLLSSNDKAFQQQQNTENGLGGSRRQTPRNRDGNGSDLVDTSGERESGGSDFTFKGKLSVGIDEIGNTLLVSAEGEPLLDLVCDMIKQLDLASRPSGDVQVVKLSGGISSQSLEAALRAFSTAKATEANRDAGRAARPGNADNADSAISP